MKLDLDVSTKVKFSANGQSLKFKNQGITGFLITGYMKPFGREL